MTAPSYTACRLALVCTLGLPLILGGCPWQQSTLPPTLDDGKDLRPFQNEQELLNYFKTQANARLNQQRSASLLGNLFFGLPGAAAAPADSSTGAEAGAGDGTNSDSYSTTNIQEAGVDESDVIKSDGQYFYIARSKSIRIVDATPLADLAEVGRLELDDSIDELYLYGGKLLALGHKVLDTGSTPGGAEILIWPPYYTDVAVVAYEIDISDPAAPAVTRRNELDGSLVTSRLTNNRLILVLTIVPDLPAVPTPQSINAMNLSDVLPTRRSGDEIATLVPATDWYYPEAPDGFYTTAIVTLDAANIETVVGGTAIMADAGTIYASPQALYVTSTEYDYAGDQREKTAVHKFAFDADGVAQYSGSGLVPGRLLNQFSLSERGGYLRLATYVSNWQLWIGAPGVAVSSDARAQTVAPNTPFNAVYVLGPGEDGLEVVGAVEDIAPNEQLYAARFLDQHGFLVTFERIDPLFVLDLADPTNPQVVGELELPGFSDYLHPWGDNYLIGVGRSAPNGWAEAVQLTLFDVSDWSAPTLVDQVEIGGQGSYSDVSYDHKAFTFLEDSGRLAIPVTLSGSFAVPYEPGSPPQYNTFEGVLCYDVTPEGFVERGGLACVQYENYWWAEWRRAAFIGDTLYAISPAGIRAADVTDLENPATLVLTPTTPDYGDWGPTEGFGGTADGAPAPL